MSKRIFISFALKDKTYSDLLKEQILDTNTPISYTYMSEKEAWSDQWKINCRTRIKGCDGVIALISKNIKLSDSAKWEMQCANEEGVSMIGVYISNDDREEIPQQLSGKRVMLWSWPDITSFINSL